MGAEVITDGGIAGTGIQATASAAVNLLGATITGRNVGIDAGATVTADELIAFAAAVSGAIVVATSSAVEATESAA